MSLFSAAERLAALDRSGISYDPGRCLHAADRQSDCKICVEICPADAIEAGSPPVYKPDQCQECLACLAVCPTGSFSADDAFQGLINCAARLETGIIELLCEHHDQPDLGLDSESNGIQIRGCLAGLGSGAYLALAAINQEKVQIRLDKCQECPWGELQSVIQSQVQLANEILNNAGRQDMIQEVIEPSEVQDRPLWDASNPPLSRRDLFRMAARQSQIALARAYLNDLPEGTRRPGRDRLRINQAVQQLMEHHSLQEDLLPAGSFGLVRISEECTACQACARSCPTRALEFEKDENCSHFQLKFSPEACIACDVCTHVCAVEAVRVDHNPRLPQIFQREAPLILIEGPLKECIKCGVDFAASVEGEYCPVCSYRKGNPFAIKLPPGVQLPGNKPEIGDKR